LSPNEQFFSYIMARTSYILIRRWWYALCTRRTHLLARNNSLWVDMLIHWDRLFWSNQFLLLLLTCCLCSRETANINFIFTIYCTRGEYANHYTTDVVAKQFYIKHNDFKIQRKETPRLSISCSTRYPPKMVFGTSSF
jgi:hypothetical protein